MSPFGRALRHTLVAEGGFSDHPDDPGGATNLGITEAVARSAGYRGDMEDLTRAHAEGIYRKLYWSALNLDAVAEISEAIAAEMFDSGVNAGVQRAGEWLQRSLNVLNNKGSLYPDIAVDGQIGPITIRTLRRYHQIREKEGVGVLFKALTGYQARHYLELAERNEKFESFIYGWLRTRI